MTDHRDLVIRELAAGEAERIDECRELAADLDSTRGLLLVALAEIARLTATLAQAKAIIVEQREERRRYTRDVVLGRVA